MIEPLADGHASVASTDGEQDFDLDSKPTPFDVIESEHEQLPAENDINFDDSLDEQLDLIFVIIAESLDEGVPVNEHEPKKAC